MTYKPTREFNGVAGQPSKDLMGPETLSKDIDKINKMFDPSSVHAGGEPGGVQSGNMANEFWTYLSNLNKDYLISSGIKYIRLNSNNVIETSVDGLTWQAANPHTHNHDDRYFTESELGSVTDGSSGADKIGATPLKPGGANKVQGQLEELQAQMTNNDNGAVHKAGTETITGNKNFTGDADFSGNFNVNGLRIVQDDAGRAQILDTRNGHELTFYQDGIYYYGGKLWNEGNDGPGSGLNADKLDDLEADDFVKTSGDQSIGGWKQFTGVLSVTTPALPSQATRKDYVDNLANARYTKTEMQTSGSSLMHWDNITNKPNLADNHWKSPVADRASLPLTGNTVMDNRVVLNDGDGKQAVYTCIATTGTIDQQWAKISDVDWMAEEQTRITQENARVAAENNREVAAAAQAQAAASHAAAAEAQAIAAQNFAIAESLRVEAEGDATKGRVKAENDRVAAENARAVFEPYDPGKAYVEGNKVFYEGSSYWCKKNTTPGILPTNTAYWQIIAKSGDGITYTTEKLYLYVSPTGNDENDGFTEQTPLKTIQKAIELIPQITAHGVQIYVSPGTYEDNIIIKGYSPISSLSYEPASINIEGYGATVKNIRIETCNVPVIVLGITSEKYSIYNSNVHIMDCTVNGGIEVYDNSTVNVSNTLIKNAYVGIYGYDTSTVVSKDNRGENLEVGLVSRNGTRIIKIGTQPNAILPEDNEYFSEGGEIVSEDINVNALAEQISTNKAVLDDFMEFPATNLVVNGDFSNGTTGWANNIYNTTISASNNVLSVTAGSSMNSSRSGALIGTGVSGKKYYIKATLRVTNAVSAKILLSLKYPDIGGAGIIDLEKLTPTQNEWYTLSGITTIPSGANDKSLYVTVFHSYADGTTANGKVMEVQYVSALDLIKIFGAGNEPTKEEMDTIMAYFPNSWFNGTVNLADYKWFMIYLLNKIRKLNTAVVALGGTV